jgi:hypothetical protein
MSRILVTGGLASFETEWLDIRSRFKTLFGWIVFLGSSHDGCS